MYSVFDFYWSFLFFRSHDLHCRYRYSRIYFPFLSFSPSFSISPASLLRLISIPGTFYGGTLTFGDSSLQDGWNTNYKEALAAKGITTYFVPSFTDAVINAGMAPSDIYTSFPAADGIFSWDTAWPFPADGKANVSSAVDEEFVTAAKSAGKTYMMAYVLAS